MATPKPQVRSTFATPVLVHFLPIAQEANTDLRPLVIEKMGADGATTRGKGWRSGNDFAVRGGMHAETLCRVARELADSATSARSAGRVTLDWRVSSRRSVAGTGASRGIAARP